VEKFVRMTSKVDPSHVRYQILHPDPKIDLYNIPQVVGAYAQGVPKAFEEVNRSRKVDLVIMDIGVPGTVINDIKKVSGEISMKFPEYRYKHIRNTVVT
jgi:CheY-like chemotaxis protein